MPRLAIIIPALDCVPALETTLVSVLEHRPSDCEILVPLRIAYSDPYHLEGEVRFLDARRDSGFAGCANRGIVESRAGIVHVLKAGCEVTENWATSALRQFGNPRVASVAPLVLNAERRDEVLAAGLAYEPSGRRSIVTPTLSDMVPSQVAPVLGCCGFAAFYRKAALERVGALWSRIGDNLADVDLALSLQQCGYQAFFDPRCRVFATAPLSSREGAFREGLYSERLFWRHAPTGGWAKLLMTHTWTAVSDTARYLPSPAVLAHLAGRLIACCQASRCRDHYRRLEQLKESAILPLAPERDARRSQSAGAHSEYLAGQRAKAG